MELLIHTYMYIYLHIYIYILPLQAHGLRMRAAAFDRAGGRALCAAEAIVVEGQRRMGWHEAAHGGSFGTGEFEAIEENDEVCFMSVMLCRCHASVAVSHQLRQHGHHLRQDQRIHKASRVAVHMYWD